MIDLWSRFTRRKIIAYNPKSTELNRVLSTLDLTLLGIGGTLGVGIYVLAGSVARNDAGPAVVISFLIAGLSSVLSALCYAEFGARVPRAGSAYAYSYVCVGELIAFVVGWNLIMEYIVGAASVAKAYSGYVDSLFDNQIQNALHQYVPLPSSTSGFLSSYVDVFAFGLVITVTVVLALGVKGSSLFNNIFTILNVGVVGFVVIAGSIFAKPTNWSISPLPAISNFTTNETLDFQNVGQGGFAPFGFVGIMKGSAACFYGFIGFDYIATTGDEAKTPQKSIPLAIIGSLFFVFLSYFGISTVLTMMVPYYLQDPAAPLPHAFLYVGFPIGKLIVSIGAIFGLSTSLLGVMFSMPRVIYAMGCDGLLFNFLSKVHPKYKTPFNATLVAGALAGIMASLLDLDALIHMISLGTLTAYTIVAICVLILRYRKDENDQQQTEIESSNFCSLSNLIAQTYNSSKCLVPTVFSSFYSGWIVFLYCIFSLSFSALAVFLNESIRSYDPFVLIPLCGIGFLLILILISLSFQPISPTTDKLHFKVPLVPFVPAASILINIYLIFNLNGQTWLRFCIWMTLGLIIYFICLFTGLADKKFQRNSNNAKKEEC